MDVVVKIRSLIGQLNDLMKCYKSLHNFVRPGAITAYGAEVQGEEIVTRKK